MRPGGRATDDDVGFAWVGAEGDGSTCRVDPDQRWQILKH